MSNFTMRIGLKIHIWNCQINPFHKLSPDLRLPNIFIFHNRLSILDQKQEWSVRKHFIATLKQLDKTSKKKN